MSDKLTTGYEVMRDGRVFSVKSNWRGYGRRELVQDLNEHGYPSVRITINGKRTRYGVHVLVAQHYLGPKPSPDHEVRHLDGDKLNSCAYGAGEEVIANACLMAAAPEMLAALRRAVLALAFAAESSLAMQDDYNAVSAAIAKATGQKQ